MKSKYFILFLLFTTLSVSRIHSQTVYITEQGKKYHAKNCTIAKTGKKGISLAEAKRLGYIACKICIISNNNSNKEKKVVPKKTEKK